MQITLKERWHTWTRLFPANSFLGGLLGWATPDEHKDKKHRPSQHGDYVKALIGKFPNIESSGDSQDNHLQRSLRALAATEPRFQGLRYGAVYISVRNLKSH